MRFKEKYAEHDLDDAISFGGNFDADKVLFFDYETDNNHLKLLENIGSVSSLTRYPQGFCLNKNKAEILEILESIIPHKEWENIFDQFNASRLNPIIQINNKMCDGSHRVILCYLMNEPVKKACFKAPFIDWSQVF